ncbi:hypothetical protein QCK34_004505 [Enterobacter asburiae]
MSNIDKQAVTEKTKELSSLMVERFSMNPVSCKLLNESWEKEFPDEVAIAKRMLVLLDELEAKDKQIAELSSLQGKPIAWESTTPVYVKFITDERYQRLRPGYQKWYKPYRCSQCAAAGKGE